MINHKGLLYSLFLSLFLSLSLPSLLLPPLLPISWALAFNCKRLQEHSRTTARRGSFINIYMHMKQANSKLSGNSWTPCPIVYLYIPIVGIYTYSIKVYAYIQESVCVQYMCLCACVSHWHRPLNPAPSQTTWATSYVSETRELVSPSRIR